MMIDILDDILGTLALSGVLYFRTDFSGPWAVQVPTLQHAARFHLVLEGSCWVEPQGAKGIMLGPGDMILIPDGLSHTLADTPGRPAPSLETVLEEAGYDGNQVLTLGETQNSATTKMLCGHFSFRDGAHHPVLDSLPDHVLITGATREEHPWLDELLSLLGRRALTEEMGGKSSVKRMSEIVFIEILRNGIARTPRMDAMLAGFRDRQISRAVLAIHQTPEIAWTVDSLASEAGMSRSGFAERFREFLGVGPITYLTEWRLQKALSLLGETQQSIQEIANSTGYQSAAAFTRAFAAKFGAAPRDFRGERT